MARFLDCGIARLVELPFVVTIIIRREIITVCEKLEITDHMKFATKSDFVNIWEFCDMLWKRWRIAEDKAIVEFNELLQDKAGRILIGTM